MPPFPSLVTHHLSWLAGFERGMDILAFVFLILLFPIPFFWLLIHPAIHFWRRFGNRAFWVALPVWVFSGTVLILLRHQILAERLHRDAWTWVVGGTLLALALWLDRHTRRDLGFRRMAGLAEMNPGHRLSGVVRTGIYTRMRHPRYVQYMLTLLSMAFLTGAPGIFLLAIVDILLYQMVAPFEERELLEHYGPSYAAYLEAVPRFLPRWRRRNQTLTSS
jgi:protein-S-isoprenylcysteine O-methyltransferase Ste14